MSALKIALAGLGTVGGGCAKLLIENASVIATRAGRALEVVAVSALERQRAQELGLGQARWFDNAVDMARAAEADVVVELIGGAEGIARAVCEAALGGKRHLVTANKALLARHANALAALAEKNGCALSYEAAVAGGIPIIKALREGLAANKITRVYGILNGTCNYILTTMRKTGRSFDEILKDAQKLGYAEADPSMDVDGIDAAHKLSLLAALAFATPIDFERVYIEGVRAITPMDIAYAEELGYRIKLVGSAQLTEDGLEQRVHPCMVEIGTPIAHVEGVTNAVVASGNFAGDTVYQGAGAGGGPTASAVVADLIDIARGRFAPPFGVRESDRRALPAAAMELHRGAYYIRLMVHDRPGVMADVTACFRDERVSIESMLQRARARTGSVPVVMTTHECQEAAMRRALAAIGRLDAIAEPPHMIRIESL
ncbi:MAG: homoserine dehydrogenase [Alphaproteobacteria bacterium]|nr:homoserine dehydrogenase [Alphaproteobacteria bacterium]